MDENQEAEISKCGYVAIVGRPNVGKSTLLNTLLGQKVSITSRKPQTTRHQILGIHTENRVQAIYVDTPGLNSVMPKAINRYMNKAATSALKGVDLVLFVVDGKRWTDEDETVLGWVSQGKCPLILVINKVDRVREKQRLLPYIESLSRKATFAECIPLSALRRENIDRLQGLVKDYLPQGDHLFPEDQVTDRSERFLAAEMVREKVMRQVGDEIPHQIAVEIEAFRREKKIVHVSALILVEREGQKKIVIGDQGERLKTIGRDARIEMERMLDCKVMLKLWVKVKGGWSDDEKALQSLGYKSV